MKIGDAVRLFALALVATGFCVEAQARQDPFAAIYQAPAPRPVPAPGAPAAAATPPSVPSTPLARVGYLSVSGAAGASYATAGAKGVVSLATIGMLPKTAAPIPVVLKPNSTKYLKGHKRIALQGYALELVRSGGASAFAGGAGSAQVARRTSLSTALVGVPDELAAQLADEAYKDLETRLKAAGYDVVPAEEVQASAIGSMKLIGTVAKGADGQPVYGPAYAPLRSGSGLTSAMALSTAAGPTGAAAKALDAIVINPWIVVDYERLGSSGTSNYTSNADVSAEVRLRVPQAGAQTTVTPPAPYKGGWPGNFMTTQSTGTDEQFGVMYEIDDRSDSTAISSAFASAGLGNMYRQSKYYAVEVAPQRYAALVRAAFQGFNTALVSEIVKASS